MSKIIITNELASTIKAIRIENNISALHLARSIGKSSSYITKLEKGDIQSISEADLLQILNNILGNKENTDAIIESVFRTLSYKYTTDEIDKLLWFYNFDTVIRTIPVPEEFCADVSVFMENNSISIETLTDRINSNEFITGLTEVERKKYPFNQWFERKLNNITETFILMNVNIHEIEGILDGSITESNYVTMLAIVLYVYKIAQFKEPIPLDEVTQNELKQQAKDYLASIRVLPLIEKQRRIESAKSKAENDLGLSSHDVENISLVNNITQKLRLYSDINIKSANSQLIELLKNFNWDASFTMRLMALDFSSLSPCSYRIKRLMLSEIEQIIQKYAACTPAERTIEDY